ncbi:MAG: rhomboid family intramembrane serine protease [Saprospiraceae bacterium]
MKFAQQIKQALYWPIVLLIIIWGVFIAQQLLHADWFIYGIAPRKTYALRGVLTTPFLHGNWSHLLSNSLPFLVLMAMIIYFYPRVARSVLLLIYLGTGVAMWLLADPEAMLSPYSHANYHIGASGVVYGMAAFLAFTGFFRRKIRAIAISLIVVFYYGGMIWGVLPIQEGVSWEGHLLGALVGVFAAYWHRKRIEASEQSRIPDYAKEPQEEQYFLPRDTFDRKE